MIQLNDELNKRGMETIALKNEHILRLQLFSKKGHDEFEHYK